MSEMMELHAIFDGEVQGVGFRMTVKYHAMALELNGTVRNLPDGRVEVYAQGEIDTLHDFVEKVKTRSGAARIDSVVTQINPLVRAYADFRIVH